jgi:hypothetical protein
MTPYIPVWLFILDRVNYSIIDGLAVIIQNLDTEGAGAETFLPLPFYWKHRLEYLCQKWVG